MKQLFAEYETIENGFMNLFSKMEEQKKFAKRMSEKALATQRAANEANYNNLVGQQDIVAQLIRALLFATKGPAHPELKAREPYAAELKCFLEEQLRKSKDALERAYEEL